MKITIEDHGFQLSVEIHSTDAQKFRAQILTLALADTQATILFCEQNDRATAEKLRVEKKP